MKRLVLFICTILCANVLSAQLPIGSVFYYENIMYEVTSENEVKVCHPRSYYEGGNCPSSIEIPSVAIYHMEIPGQGTFHEEYSVTSIGEGAFSGCSSLTSVSIPESITFIGSLAFEGCSLTTLNFNAINCIIGFFHGYGLPEDFAFEGSSINTINIGNRVQIISDYFARGLSGLNYVNFEDNSTLTSIGKWAFIGCDSLTSFTIPNSVTSIGDAAFSACSSLTSISIPNSVTSIGGGLFYGCNTLTSVAIPNNITELSHCVAESGARLGFFENCRSLTSVTIPNSVTSIGIRAFAGCSSLTSVTIPNSVTYIAGRWERGVFENCSSLTSITFGESVTSIGSGAFNGCSFLQNVTCLATTPPTLADNTVFPYPNIATLTVPCGTLEAYSSATSFWNMFFAGRIEEDCSGLEDAEFAELSVYPNPTRGKVSFSQAIEKIEVIDLSGKTLQTYENANEINIESLPAGVYHLRMTIGDKTTTRKVIKE